MHRQHHSGGGEPLRGNAAAGLADLLATLGVKPTGEYDAVTAAVQAALASRALPGSVVSQRWGHVVVETDRQSAHLLDYERDVLLAELTAACPGQVRTLRFRVTR